MNDKLSLFEMPAIRIAAARASECKCDPIRVYECVCVSLNNFDVAEKNGKWSIFFMWNQNASVNANGKIADQMDLNPSERDGDSNPIDEADRFDRTSKIQPRNDEYANNDK